jgi:hypothetical protein
MIGDAYRDIVALAAGQQGETHANSASYKPEAADVRTKAIAKYRAGLALDGKSEASSIARGDRPVKRPGRSLRSYNSSRSRFAVRYLPAPVISRNCLFGGLDAMLLGPWSPLQ